MNASPVSIRLLLSLGIRQMRSRMGRALLTTLSVVIGVAGLVAVTTATNVTRNAYRDMSKALAGQAALEVASASGAAISQDLVEQLERLPGVRTAAPLLQRPTTLYLEEVNVRAVVLGIDPARYDQLHEYVIDEGVSLADADGALLDSSFARSCGLQVGDEIRFFTRTGMQRVNVIGLTSPRGVSTVRLGGTMWLRLTTAQRYMRSAGRVDTIQILLDEQAEEAAARAQITAQLPEGVSIREPDADAQLAEAHLHAASTGLSVGSAYTLLGAAFIILNTFIMNVTDRRRELGIQRAIGATRRQVTLLLLAEGLLLGIVGTAIGVGVGLAGASVLLRAMEALFNAPLPGVTVNWWSVAAGSACGLGIALLATFFPARRAASVSPLEAMRRGVSAAGSDSHRLMLAAGLLLGSVATWGLVAVVLGQIEPLLSVPAGLSLLVAIILIIPTFLPLLLRMTAPLLAATMGIEGRIASRQLLRWRLRTALTVGVIFTAAGTGIGLGNSILSNVNDVRRWTRLTVVADFMVRGVVSSTVTGTATAMPAEVGPQLAELPGVAQIEAMSFVRSRVNDTPVLVVAREFGKHATLPLDVKEGDLEALPQQLRAGELAIGTVLAQRLKLHAGDMVELAAAEGPRKVRVAAVVTDYQVGGMMLYMDRPRAEAVLGLEGADVYLISASANQLAEVEAALQTFCRQHGLILQSYADLARLIDGLMAGMEAGLWAILALQFLVAGLGIANTLTMNVLEQTREIGLLRIVGSTRRQIRKIVFAQAAMIGLVSLLMGLPGGAVVAWILNLCTRPVTGQRIEFTLQLGLFAWGAVIALAILIAAAWFPARRAAGLPPSEALAYE